MIKSKLSIRPSRKDIKEYHDSYEVNCRTCPISEAIMRKYGYGIVETSSTEIDIIHDGKLLIYFPSSDIDAENLDNFVAEVDHGNTPKIPWIHLDLHQVV